MKPSERFALVLSAAALAASFALSEAIAVAPPVALEDAEIVAALENSAIQYQQSSERFCPNGEWYATSDQGMASGRYSVSDGEICVREDGAPPEAAVCRRVYRNEMHYYLRMVGPIGRNEPALQPVRIGPAAQCTAD